LSRRTKKDNAAPHGPGLIQKAWNSRGKLVGKGSYGSVYRVPNLFEGEHAVIKQFQIRTWDREVDPEREITNLKIVRQFLGHGVKVQHGSGEKVYYIVMKDMGMTAEETKLPQRELQGLANKAQERYLKDYGMKRTYVRHHTDG
jgi:hypothetical protein